MGDLIGPSASSALLRSTSEEDTDQADVLQRLAHWAAPVALVFAPMLVWFAAFKPGMMTGDSLFAWDQAGSGRWIDVQPPAYTAAMWVSRAVLGTPSLLTLSQALLLAVGMVSLARSVIRLGAPRVGVVAVTAVLALTPMVGGFAVTLWKDVPYTAFFLLLTGRTVDLVRAHTSGDDGARTKALRSMIPAAAGLVLMRQNGFILVVALAVGLAVFSRDRWRQLVLLGLSALALLLVIKVVVFPLAGIEDPEPRFAIGTLLTDIAAVAYAEPERITGNDRRAVEEVAPLEVWADAFIGYGGCRSANWLHRRDTFDWDVVNRDPGRFRAIALRLAGESPGRVMGNHMCLGAIAWKPGPEPPTVMFNLGRNIDPNPAGLEVVPLWRGLNDLAVDLLDLTDRQGISWLLWRAPLRIYLAAGAVALAAFRHRRVILLAVLAPLVAQQVSVLAVNFAQDSRYMAGALIAAPILFTLGWWRPPVDDPARDSAVS